MPGLGINIRNTDFEKLMLVIMKLAEFSQSHKKFEAVVTCDLENKKISLKFYEQTQISIMDMAKGGDGNVA